MRMNGFDGKRFLAAVRGGQDFAHAGEAEAIDLVFENVEPDSKRLMLDAGCGRGGTADYVQRKGWGNVVGVDIDSQSVEYARTAFPNCQFEVCDLCFVHEKFPGKFDLIYSFNVIYAVPDKEASFASLRKTAKDGAPFLLFDYITYKPEVELPGVLSGPPATLEQFDQFLPKTGWSIVRRTCLDDLYVKWYENFLKRFDEQGLSENFEPQMIEPARKKYSDLLAAIQNRVLGGIFLEAVAR